MAKNEKNARGFTLIELLVVVVVIATMMGILFRLAGVGSDQKARNITITRMQKLEFALSGYFAAFGSYPPVPLHGSRDIFCGVNDYGIQYIDGQDSSQTLQWKRVRAACLSQPIACEFPFNAKSELVKSNHKMWQQKNSSDSSCNLLEDGDKSKFPNKQQLQKLSGTLWQKEQLFKFGVLSFLLPRFIFMLEGPNWMYDSSDYSSQWNSENDLRTIFYFGNGRRMYAPAGSGTDKCGWEAVQRDTSQGQVSQYDDYDQQSEYKSILAMPSQAVCARWIQALDGIVECGGVDSEFFGVNLMVDHDDNRTRSVPDTGLGIKTYYPIYSPSKTGPTSSGGNEYRLNEMTVQDGWDEEFFYYSPPPYQNYRLWSAGPNLMTIPPWVDFESPQMRNHREEGAKWIADDIVGLSTPAN